MIWVNAEDVIAIHSQIIKKSGGSDGLRDRAGLEAAIDAPLQSFGGVDFYPSVIDKIARLGYGLTNMAPEENRKILWTLNKIFSRVGLEHDILLSMFLLDKKAFYARKPILPFYQNIEKDGVVVYAA